MKKSKLFFSAIIFLLTFGKSFSQEYQLQEKTVIAVFDTPGKTKSEIFSSVNRWISINYNSAQNVVQLNDKEAGNIIVKGVNEVVYKNLMKEFQPNNKYAQEYSTIKFNHTIEINIKDDKFRVIYTLTDIADKVQINGYGELYTLLFDLIDLTGLKDEPVNRYNAYIVEKWNSPFISKKKTEKMLEMTRPVFEQVNKDITVDLKSTIESIYQSVNSTKNEDW